MARKIRVAILDDSIVFREYLARALGNEPSFEIVGKLSNPVQAINEIASLRPDVITVDMEMPRMRGDEFMKTVLPKHPGLRAVVISALSGNVFDAMHAGATDFVGKPGSAPGYTNEQFVNDIIQKIKIAAAAKSSSQLARPVAAARAPAPSVGAGRGILFPMKKVTSKSIIAIGASTGGTEAIIEVVKKFPANAPGVVIVQHMPAGFTKMYAERLDRTIAMSVREAKNGDKVERGTILIAPGGEQQMRVRPTIGGYQVSIAPGGKVSGHCPSVDVLFESVADAAGNAAVGVLLTGMGADGAENLLKMRKRGAHTIGQNEDSCVVYGMPKVAYDIGGVAEQLPLSSIGDAVLRRF